MAADDAGAGADSAAGAVAPPPIEATDPGAGPAPEPGGGFKQPAIASSASAEEAREANLIGDFVYIFAVRPF